LDQVLDAGFASIVLRTLEAGGDEVLRLYHQPFPVSDADERLVNLGLSPLGTAEGGTHWVVTVDDVTEEAKKEEALVQQERLASIGLLASGVAHEVNTPLTGIASYAQMLLEGLQEGDPHYDLLKKIEGQSFRASDIANRLLNFSRPDGDSFEVLELNELVEETLSLFELQMRKSRVFVYRELGEDLSPIEGNRGKLQQVILNLLLNAQDSMGSEIRIRTSEERLGIRLDVEDNGEGIPQEVLGRIYDPFFTTKAPGKGTGLGLSISYGIVQEHAGTISVDSRVGGGTCFSVFLPRARRDRVAAS
jgi:two-component system NtrC family sensor kinase